MTPFQHALEYGVCIWNVKAKSTFKSYLLEINVLFILQCPNLNIQCIMFCMMSHTHFCPAFVIRNITQFKKIIFLPLLRHASLAATKRTCAPHKFVKMYDPSPTMKQPYFQLLTNGRSILQSFWNTPLHPFTFLTPLPINEVNDAFQKIVFQWLSMGNEDAKKIQARNFDDVCIHHQNFCSESFFHLHFLC
jgi:hypothetical protein